MSRRDAIDQPLEVTRIEGDVVVRGADATALSLTPVAAEITAARLRKAARSGATDNDEAQE